MRTGSVRPFASVPSRNLSFFLFGILQWIPAFLLSALVEVPFLALGIALSWAPLLKFYKSAGISIRPFSRLMLTWTFVLVFLYTPATRYFAIQGEDNLKVVWFFVVTLFSDVAMGSTTRSFFRAADEKEWDLANLAHVTFLVIYVYTFPKSLLRMTIVDPIIVAALCPAVVAMEVFLRTTTAKRDKLYDRFCCRGAAAAGRHESSSLTNALAVIEMLNGAAEPALTIPLAALFSLYQVCSPGSTTPLRVSVLAFNVLSNYVSEGFGEMLTLQFGPFKPFLGAEF